MGQELRTSVSAKIQGSARGQDEDFTQRRQDRKTNKEWRWD
jgi:hypothetical protein